MKRVPLVEEELVTVRHERCRADERHPGQRERVLRLLAEGNLRVVGSVLTKEDPRDLDLILVIPSALFVELYMPVDQYDAESKSGAWSMDHYRWSDDSIYASRVMQRRMRMTFRASLVVDLKILPQYLN